MNFSANFSIVFQISNISTLIGFHLEESEFCTRTRFYAGPRCLT